jgi:hypothetical protein
LLGQSFHPRRVPVSASRPNRQVSHERQRAMGLFVSPAIFFAAAASVALLSGSCGGQSSEAPPLTQAPGTTGNEAVGETAAQAPDTAAAGGYLEPFEVDIESQDESSISGAALLRPTEDGQTSVVLRLTGIQGGSRQALIHEGSCDELGEPVFTLRPVERNRSVSRVSTSYDQLRTGGFAVAVHLSPSSIGDPLACGDIKGEAE